MIINETHKFIYLKTRKTASTSLEEYFAIYNTPLDEKLTSGAMSRVQLKYFRFYTSRHHAAAIEIKPLVDNWDSFRKITSVRNPFNKVISGFFFLTKTQNRLMDEDESITNFNQWVANYRNDENFLQLVDDYIYRIDDQVCADYFIRVEHMYDDIKDVCNNLGLEFYPNEIQKLNVSTPNWATCSNMYSEQSREIIEKLFSREIKLFDYKFDQ